MSTAVIFPGLNTIMRRKDRERFLNLHEVQSRFQQAENILHREFNRIISFNSLATQPTEILYNPENIGLAALMASSIQVGTMDRLSNHIQQPDWVMGCSLGDLARSVSSGACGFENAIAEAYRFTCATRGIDSIGGNFGIRAGVNNAFTKADLEWFDIAEIDVSQLSSRFITASCRFQDMPILKSYAHNRKWKVTRLIFDFPVHSRHIKPYIQHDKTALNTLTVVQPKIRIFSSILCKPLDSPAAIRNETEYSAWNSIHWEKSIRELANKYGVTQFINVGPCKSLSLLMREIPVHVKVWEAVKIIRQPDQFHH